MEVLSSSPVGLLYQWVPTTNKLMAVTEALAEYGHATFPGGPAAQTVILRVTGY